MPDIASATGAGRSAGTLIDELARDLTGEARIHPTAEVDPSARIDPTSRIGAGARIEADVIVGPGCIVGPRTRLRPRSIIVEHTVLGVGNEVHPFVVLGGDPQDRAADPTKRNRVIIGDENIFREGVTIHRGTNDGPPTMVGSRCYMMVQSHIGHNARLGDGVTMANCAALAGHAHVGDNCVISAYAAIHQFTTVGEGVMLQGGGGVSMHVPPFVVVSANVNDIAGLNKVGLRRNPSLTDQDRADVKRVFKAVYVDRGARSLETTVNRLSTLALAPAAVRFLDFLRMVLNDQPPRRRGLCGMRRKAARAADLEL